MKKAKTLLTYAVKWLLPLALTILLVTYMFRKVNFSDMARIIHEGVNLWWILLAMVMSVFSHVFRAFRWRIQLRSIGVNAPLTALICSIFGTYALNLVFPRLGEIWRCSYVSNLEKKPFTEVVGTMVADRLFDMVMVVALLVLSFIVAAPAIIAFLVKYPMGRGLIEMFENPWALAALVGGLVLIWAIFDFGRNLKPIAKTRKWIGEMWHGFASIARMEGKWKFFGFTLLIWGCYYFQMYVAFFAFPFTAQLCTDSSLAFGLVPCLVVFVLSSISMAIPSNGGLGPWNIAVMFGLVMYGVADTEGTAFSMVQWSGQTIMLIILGIYTMGYIMWSARKRARVAGIGQPRESLVEKIEEEAEELLKDEERINEESI